MKKKCIICGKVFEAKQSNFILCSDECRRKRYNYKQSQRNITYCGICGKPVESEMGATRMVRKDYHEECVIKEALKAISEGAGCKDKRIKRAYNTFAYGVKELKKL